MKLAHKWALAPALAGLIAAPAMAEAQDLPGQPQQQAQPPQPPTEIELVFDREIFAYPAFTRRNPFQALSSRDGGGPNYDELSLIGIMYSTDPSASVAVVSTGGVAVAEDGTISAVDGDAYYVKVGETLGNLTVREIHRDRVEVTVSEFDEQIPRTMIFLSRRPGGSP